MSLMTCRLLRSGTSAANAAEDESAKASAIRNAFLTMMDSPSPRPRPGDADAIKNDQGACQPEPRKIGEFANVSYPFETGWPLLRTGRSAEVLPCRGAAS